MLGCLPSPQGAEQHRRKPGSRSRCPPCTPSARYKSQLSWTARPTRLRSALPNAPGSYSPPSVPPR